MSNLKAAIASLDHPTRALLAQHYFDEDTLVHMAQVLTSDTQDVNTNLIGGDLEPPAPQNLHTLPDIGSPESVEFRQLGEDAIAAGEVMILVLNGGMATRFGGVVKGVVSVDRKPELPRVEIEKQRGSVQRPLPTCPLAKLLQYP